MTAIAEVMTQSSRATVANQMVRELKPGSPLACLLASLLVQAVFSGAASAEPAATVPSATLILSNGDRITGGLVDTPDGGRLLWKAPGFADNLQFPLDGVQGVRFPVPEKLPEIASAYAFELSGGDMLFGSLVSLDDKTALIESPGLGRLHVAREVLLRMDRRTSSELVFGGLSGLDGWRSSSQDASWREDAGHLVADKPGASIHRDLQIPAQARIEIELAWNSKPNFEVRFADSQEPKAAPRRFQLDVWDDELVALCETNRDADLASVEEFKGESGRVSLQVFLDQTRGRMLIASANGVPLADLSVAIPTPLMFGCLRIIDRAGGLRLEKLRIYKWNAEPPRVAAADRSRMLLVDGTVAEAHLSSFDAAEKTFTVSIDGAEQPIDQAQLQGFIFRSAAEAAPRSLQAILLSGMRLGGELLKVEGDCVFVQCPGIQESLSLPLESLQAITILHPNQVTPNLTGRIGRLEVAGTVLHGCLVDGSEEDASCLAWHPLSGAAASRLARGVTARIVYRDSASTAVPRSVNPAARVRPFVVGQDVLQQLRKRAPRSDSKPADATAPSDCVLHLRSGDTIPVSDTTVDERGIHFKSSVSDATFVPHAQVKVLELLPNVPAVQIVKSKKQRLLTLPRMQRDSPPTQLIRAVNGDYLRGRLLAMDGKQLEVEMRLESKTVPRQSVARIIWLHADELDPAAPAPEVERATGTRVQALPRSGNRLTFLAEKFAGTTLSGRSDLLGNCHVDVGDIDVLLVESAIEKAAATLAFHQWRLTPAIDPLEFQENGTAEDGSTEGLESVLVGKPAPDFNLDLLDGKTFRLSDRKDTILVLDFWASWCGPCLQAMPQVDEVVREFADQRVELVAVNLQETPDQIKSALERLRLTTNVALDRDGRVAEKYGATAIPQTVIIGRDGKVARLFVGGGARFDEQLREALQSVLAASEEQAKATP
jgi:thiol-disulfide isomerase/thioredoxin